MLAKIKSKFNHQCRKIAVTLHCCTETKIANAYSSPDFTIPPLEFSQKGLSVITTDAFETAQRSVVVESQTLASADGLELSEIVDKPTAISPATGSASAS